MKPIKACLIAVLLVVALLAIPAAAVRPCTWNHGACVGACLFSPGQYGCGDLSPSQRANCCAASCNDGACYNAGWPCGLLCPGGPPECYNDGDCGDGEACEGWICVPVSCPAIPCGDGLICEENQCVSPPDPCEGVQCGDGAECVGGTCIPMTCPAIPCDLGYECVDHTCSLVPPPDCDNSMAFRASIPASSDPTPYSVGPAPAEVEFLANSGTAGPLPEGATSLWNFGDGTTATDAVMDIYGQLHITHTYTEPGIYSVSLVVTFPEGCPEEVSETKEAYLLVEGNPVVRASEDHPFSNSYWGAVGGCDGALSTSPTVTLETVRGPVVLHAMNRYPGGGITGLDGMKVFYRTGTDGSFNPTCSLVLYNGQCAEEKAYGDVPTLMINNPEEKIRVVVCKDEGTAAGSIITLSIRRGGEEILKGTMENCLDVTVGIPANCDGCRVKPGLAPIFRPEWFAPIFSPKWAICPAVEG